MFVQVIRGRTDDPAGFRRQMDRWEEELQPGAIGFFGSTGGITADGEVVVIARFESGDAAQANSERPEQSAWWSETEKYFSGDVTFRNSSDVEVFAGGGSDDAGFVQVMEGTISDREKLLALEQRIFPQIEDQRSGFIGVVRAHHEGGRFTAAAYFTSEAEARAGEQEGPPEELAGEFAEWDSLMSVDRYLDLTEPVLRSA